MRIYVAYKLSGEDFKRLKERLEEVSDIINKLGHESFIFVRDVQNWKPGNMDAKEIMDRAFLEMKKSDVLLAVLESAEKGEGLLIESGYMKGIGKKIILASKKECRGFLLRGIVDDFFEFEDMKDFEDGLVEVLRGD